MPIDPNIALSFKPAVALDDPMQQYGRMQQIQANAMEMQKAGLTNALAAKKLREDALTNQLVERWYNTEGERDPEKLMSAMAAHNLGAQIPGMSKSLYENVEQKNKADKTGEEATVAASGTRRMLLDYIGDSPDEIKGWVRGNYEDKRLGSLLNKGGHSIDQALAAVDAAAQQGPQALAALKKQMAMGLIEFTKQNAPKFFERNLGDKSVLTSVPGLGGPASTVAGSELNIATPDQIVTPAEGGMFRVNPRGGGFEEVRQGGGIPGARAAAPAGMPAAAGAPAAGVTSIVANNNPGALEYRPWMKKYGGEPSADGRFAAFPSPEQGAAAQEALLRLDYIGKGVNTIDKIVDKYLGTGAENTPEQRANYKATLVQQLGIPANAQLQPGVVPKLAAAMRGFETGAGGGAPAAPAGAPTAPQAASTEGLTLDQIQKRKAASIITNIMGWNPATGQDRVRDLIKASPSGVLDTASNWFKGQQSKEGTPATNAAAALKSMGANMTLALAGGHLGAGFSDADRNMVEKQTGDIANTLLPTGDRLAAYDELQRFLAPRLGIEYAPPKSGGGGKGAPPASQAQGSLPQNIAAGIKPGHQATLTDGSVWAKDAQGNVTRVR